MTFLSLALLVPLAGPPADSVYQALAKRAAALKPSAAELRYLDMPWVIDLNEALRQAKAEHRPIFFWAAGGRERDGVPLERC